MRKHYFITLFLILLCCLAGKKTHACKCSSQTFEETSERSDLIFSGIVINRRDSISSGEVIYTFQVNNIWKGNSYKTLTIKTNYGGQACGETFNLNKEYVVFSNNLKTNRCSRNCETSVCSDIARLNYKYITSYKQSIGVDTSPILSEFESDYLKTLFKDRSDTTYRMDFTNKKIAFIHGYRIITKNQFFEQYGTVEAPTGFEKFSESEVVASGGYVGIISLYRKLRFTKREKKKMIKSLS